AVRAGGLVGTRRGGGREGRRGPAARPCAQHRRRPGAGGHQVTRGRGDDLPDLVAGRGRGRAAARPGRALAGRLGAERGRGAVLLEYLGNCDRAVLVLEVLQDGQQGAGGGAGAVQRVHVLQLAVPPVADVEPPGLVVRGVRARGDLAVALLDREPRLDVVLLGRGRAQVADRDVHHPVRQAEGLDDALLV